MRAPTAKDEKEFPKLFRRNCKVFLPNFVYITIQALINHFTAVASPKESTKIVRRNCKLSLLRSCVLQNILTFYITALAASKQLASEKMDRVGKMIKENGTGLRRRASVMLKDIVVKEKKIVRKAIGSGVKKAGGKKAGEVGAEEGPFELEDTSKAQIDFGVFAQIRDVENLGERIREMLREMEKLQIDKKPLRREM